MIKAVLDTNVLVSATLWRGNPYQILLAATQGEISAASSEPLLEEFKRVLARDFNLPAEEIAEAVADTRAVLTLVKTHEEVKAVKEDPSDDRVLECALAFDADYIVSGDKHLLKLKEFRGTPIVSPAEFLRRIGTR